MTMTSLKTEIMQSKLFAEVSMELVERVINWCPVIEASPGQILIERDCPNSRVFILLEGRLNVHLGSLDSPHFVALEVGDCAGEMSIIEEREASAHVVADIPSRLLVMQKEMLWALINESHVVSRNLLYCLAGRLRRDNESIENSIRLQSEFEHMAYFDALSGLHNRRWMDQAFPPQIKRSQYAAQSLAVLMIDIDQFKLYNDTHGHLAGDKAICGVGQLLNANLRPGDLLARYGGEEFAILLPHADRMQAELVAERLRHAIASSNLPGAPELPRVTVSIGYTQLARQDTLAKLLSRADKALYVAKQSGRNCVKGH